MRSNRKHTVKELEKYIQLYLEEGKSFRELRDNFGLLLSDQAFGQKVLRYQGHGLSGIQNKSQNNQYSKQFKEMVIQEHLQKGIPVRWLARKYNIPSHETVRRWIIKYTRGEEIRSYTPQPEVYTMKSKKTIHEEKIEIVKDCLENGLSYKDTAKKYGVPYSQVYSWVQKYKDHGPAGLVDGRGRRKPDEIQTTEEKLRTQIAALEAHNKYLETENAALKKLKEVERELMLRERGMKQNIRQLRNSKKKGLK